jgi:cobalt-zinc-cadmium efflux system protein
MSAGHGHDHSHDLRAGERHRRPLAIAFGLIVAFLVVQVVVGLSTGSLTLLSDAGHMATDSVGLGMALAAIHAASRRSADARRTFGSYRLEVLAALANAVLLFGVAIYVLVEAAARLGDPPDVASGPVLVVGTVGLLVNVAAFLLLRSGATESLNVRGAYMEVLADMLGSVGVIVAAVVMLATGWGWVDPVVGAAIGLFVLPRAARLARDVLRVLLQQAPSHIDLEVMSADLAALDGVTDVHDLHLWTLTSDMDVLTAHLMHDEAADGHAVLDAAQRLLEDRYGVRHATLQVEPQSHEGCDRLHW